VLGQAQRAEVWAGNALKGGATASLRIRDSAGEKAAMERAEPIAYTLSGRCGSRACTRDRLRHAAATKLNERNIESPMGGRWTGVQLQRMARRLRLNHPSDSLPLNVARVRIQALWKQHPELTGKQVIASLGLKDQHLLGIYRTRILLRECRLAAADRSPVHRRRVGGLIAGLLNESASAQYASATLSTPQSR